MLEQIMEYFPEEEILKADGFDDAIIGIEESSGRLIYSVSKCLKVLERDMSEEDASEYFWYNVHSAWIGDKTPIWCLDTM